VRQARGQAPDQYHMAWDRIGPLTLPTLRCRGLRSARMSDSATPGQVVGLLNDADDLGTGASASTLQRIDLCLQRGPEGLGQSATRCISRVMRLHCYPGRSEVAPASR